MCFIWYVWISYIIHFRSMQKAKGVGHQPNDGVMFWLKHCRLEIWLIKPDIVYELRGIWRENLILHLLVLVREPLVVSEPIVVLDNISMSTFDDLFWSKFNNGVAGSQNILTLGHERSLFFSNLRFFHFRG